MNATVDQGSEPFIKPLFWIASCRDDLRTLPEAVKDVMGFALYLAQRGEKHVAAKPLKGFGGASVLEMKDNQEGNTYRVVYTVKFAGIVYALDAFQKKSKKGIKTSKADVDRIKTRLKLAEEHFVIWQESQPSAEEDK